MVLQVPQAMLARSVDALPAGAFAYEAKWDGFRAFLVRSPGLPPRVLSRHGTDLTTAFADIADAADRDLPHDQFDVLRLGEDIRALPYEMRRQHLEQLFADLALGPPWTLCPMTRDRDQAEQWMEQWAAVGIEGCIAKPLRGRYEGGKRGWLKVKSGMNSNGCNSS
ncbi:hypothetical protein QMK19_39125 [Streptomyces sp. H10-C2]|uniref:ATP-dependent DNA ligase n=1 Tax=unclassified Streptomyces TaxID=2593676 RepID=UPI0024B8A7FA|nr:MULTISPECIES: hypothetical protein [unclassified Streptomyces]MDJ0347202.1 hypothetical protein [Streptomyces sp. PH10-H1]MDJ0375449.1 hypothetical protein [Streptomyces sp. H10-C2]